jgi:ubiquinone/menaquinone biosynthesis C-methylase UbiE
MPGVDYDQVAATYDAGRAPGQPVVRNWRRAVLRRVSRSEIARLVDVGAGTGVWSTHLHQWFDATVVAVEPSSGMRAVAATRNTRGVYQIAGVAEALPLRDTCCDAAYPR